MNSPMNLKFMFLANNETESQSRLINNAKKAQAPKKGVSQSPSFGGFGIEPFFLKNVT